MFFPLGFGGFPFKLPIVVILLATLCLTWSIQFFPTITQTDQIIGTKLKTENFESLVAQIRLDSCVQKFSDAPACGQILGTSSSLTTTNSSLKDKIKQITTDKTLLRNVASLPDTSISISSARSEEILNYGKQFQLSGQWPAKAHKLPGYSRAQELKQFVTKTFADQGYFSPANSGLVPFLRASFVHNNWMHLLGNLILLVLLGVWVEQCLGILLTALIFLGGSFVGLYLELFITQPPALLGASAGIMALMGAYFILFYKTEMQLMFVLFPVYFKRISVPALWFFPFFYLLTDFIEVSANSGNGVAHWGHIGGLLFGMSAAWFFRQQIPLGADELFPQEKYLVKAMSQETDPETLWKLGKTLLRWNPQNWTATILFLKKYRELKLSLRGTKNRIWLEKTIAFASGQILKRRAVPEMIEWLDLIPESLELEICLKSIPLSQLLFLADHCANNSNYSLAKRLYVSALEKKPNADQENRIHSSIALVNSELSFYSKRVLTS